MPTASYKDTGTVTIEKNEDQWSKISNSYYLVQANFNCKVLGNSILNMLRFCVEYELPWLQLYVFTRPYFL